MSHAKKIVIWHRKNQGALWSFVHSQVSNAKKNYFQTRYTLLDNPEKLRPHIDDFLEKVFLTDSVLLYAPSQVALAAILHAASTAAVDLDNYVTDILFPRERLAGIVEAVRSKRELLMF